MAKLPGSDPASPRSSSFTPEVLDKTVIAIPLLKILAEERDEETKARKAHKRYIPRLIGVILDLNLEYRQGRDSCRQRVRELVAEAIVRAGTNKAPGTQGINNSKSDLSNQYMFAKLEPSVIRELVRLDNQREVTDEQHGETDEQRTTWITQRAIYRIWPDFKIKKLTTKSVSTVKADAARVSFSAFGAEVVWAVIDSGIDGGHPHFESHQNLELKEPLRHRDFTADEHEEEQPLVDEFGHGTHVAGIIAGEMSTDANKRGDAETPKEIRAVTRHRDEFGDITYDKVQLREISGMAPRCKLVSFKVLDKNGDGEASSLIAAIEQIQQINRHGRRLRIHGVNMSVGYEFEPEWFACGQSPLCVEVDLLVRSGVVVVVAAGNTGYGYNQDFFKGTAVPAGLDLTINDPGNAEMAITVGSTHREMPHVYGVSYFSSKGPTGDGRNKPDLVAPGEKILSCAAGEPLKKALEKKGDCEYVEDSGTSMAAPHVSGVIAAFLSIRREFIGKPETVKELFLSSATDLKRDRHFQGHGLVDLMRAIQSV
jgi:serine protease AprX